MFKRIFKFIKNKFVITILVFVIWMSAIDRNSLIVQYKLHHELKDLRLMKAYYISEIDKDRLALHDISTNAKTLEKFGRERYLMKKDNEDIFLVIKEKKE